MNVVSDISHTNTNAEQYLRRRRINNALDKVIEAYTAFLHKQSHTRGRHNLRTFVYNPKRQS